MDNPNSPELSALEYMQRRHQLAERIKRLTKAERSDEASPELKAQRRAERQAMKDKKRRRKQGRR